MNNAKKITTVSWLVATVLTLSGCELLGPKPVTKLPLPPVAKELPNEQSGVVFKELQNKPAALDNKRAKVEIFPGNDRFTAPAPTQQRQQSKGTGAYSLNFDEADLGEVSKVILSDILGQNYVLSPKVVGKVTLQTTEALTKEELLPTLEMVLRMNNAVLIKDGRIYHIEPAAEALYSANFSAPGNIGRTGYQVKVIPIKNVAVEEIVEVIKPLVQEKTILNIDGTRNILMVSGTPDELGRVMDMVSTFDIDVLKGRSFALFQLAHTEPETIIAELEEVFDKKDAGEDSRFFRFIPIERLNAVLAITHQAGYLKDIESWVFRLDRANSVTGGGVNVYKVQHVDAVELADTLNDIFGAGGGQSKEKPAKLAPGKKATTISNKSTSADKTDTKKSSNSQRNTAKASGSTQTGDTKVANVGEVKIIADEPNNSVVIVATAQEYEIIRGIINQLDVMPLQVLIDATIAEVTLNDKLEYGIQWYFREGNTNIGSGLGNANLSDIAVAGAAATATGGLSLLQNSGSIKALLSAEAAIGNVNIISSPSLMVLNNQEASIQVGDEISLSTGSLGNLNSNNNNNGNTNNVFSQQTQRKTGVKLKVKPRVNASGLVIMEIEQSVEDLGTKVINGNPNIVTREITSSVAVQSGEAIVLGGLIKNNESYNKSGIPFLHQVPLIGPLFGSNTRDNIKTELVVLLTPRVVKTRQDARVISDEFKRKLTGIYEEVPANFTPPRGYIPSK